MLTKHAAYKYDILFTGPFVITQYFTNGAVSVQCDPKTISYIRRIKPCKSDTKV